LKRRFLGFNRLASFIDDRGIGGVQIFRNRLRLREGPGAINAEHLAGLVSGIHSTMLSSEPDARVIIEGSYINNVDGRSRNRIARLQSSSAPIIGPASISAGIFSLDVAAIAGKTYGVEASPNPVNRSLVLSTNAAVDNFTFQEAGVLQLSQRFFRVFKSP
jgi:hypothetical protein